MKRIISLAIIAILIAGIFAVIPFSVRTANATLPDNYISIEDGGRIRNDEFKIDGPVCVNDPVPYYSIGDQAPFYYANFYDGYYYFSMFTLVGISAHAEAWVKSNGFAWPAGDPRSTPVIYANEINFLLNEFDTLIYPTDVGYFGAPAVRDGSASDWYPPPTYTGSDRVILLLMNIRDQNFYDPTYPYYVAGYFSPTVSFEAGRNIVTIDTYAWERRLGAPGTQWIGGVTVDHPYVYDSTLAHEFQHLIHADLNPSDDTFMNEGCSMYAEFLCGFGIDPSYINSYLYTPDNSLTVWGDQESATTSNILADYGAAGMWCLYLIDHYGSQFLGHFVQAGIPGIDGVNAALTYFGYKHTAFDDVFHDWRLANLIHTDFPGCTKYNYKSINLNDPAYISAYTHTISGLPVPETKGTDFGTTKSILGYDSFVSEIGPYGSDYIKFTDWNRPGFIYFDGNDYADVPGWTMTADGWWSGTGVDLQDASIAGTATVNAANPTLTIVTKYSIESYWDFGFVQVSADKGATWTSLSNSYTTSDHNPSAHPAIIAQLPGLTGDILDGIPSPDWPGWTTMSFDLTAYAGKTVQIRFRYMTDWAYEAEGWWINSATVSGTPLTLAVVPYKATFQVTIVQAFVLSGKTLYVPLDMSLTKDTNKGMGIGAAMKPSYVLLVVSPTMHRGFTDYKFQATKLPLFKFC